MNKNTLSAPGTLAEQLALWLIPGLGSKHIQKLLDFHDSINELFEKPYHYWIQMGLSPRLSEQLTQRLDSAVEYHLHWAQAENCHIVSYYDNAYPALLREISDPPLLLFVKGQLKSLSLPQLAIVGTRKPTSEGVESAMQFAHELARHGLSIASGLAIGIDAASHRGALKSGSTMAILGSGINQLYPKQHDKLASLISEQGALVSEYPLNQAPIPSYFPRRNRLISGVSLGTLVIEAGLKSGSLITAEYALEQNRDVFAIPSSIFNKNADGCHSLIKQGAKIATSPQDILDEYSHLGLTPSASEPIPKGALNKITLDKEHQLLVKCFGHGVTPVDALIKRSELPVQSVNTLLTMLELGGVVQRVTGGYTLIA